MFGRQRTEGGLDARIAELSARRAKVDGVAPFANALLPERSVRRASFPLVEPETSAEDRLMIAREELSARLGAEIRPERRALLSRGDLAKIVDAAVQAYFVRHAIDANPLSRRDLVTDIMQSLLVPGGAERTAPAGAIRTRRRSRQPRRKSSRSSSNTWTSPRRPRCRARRSRRS